MMLARVVGEVVATTKHAYLTGQKLLLVLPVDPDGNPVGRVQIAVDCAQAGPGDHVLVLDEGNGAAQVLMRPRGPTRTVIVGIVDAVSVAGPGGHRAGASPS